MKQFGVLVILLLILTLLLPTSGELYAKNSLQRTERSQAYERLEVLEERRNLEDINFHMGLGLSDELKQGYESLATAYPQLLDVYAWSLYRIAEYYYSRDRFEEAIVQLRKISNQYKQTEAATESLLLIAEILDSPYNPNRNSEEAALVLSNLESKNRSNNRIAVQKMLHETGKRAESRELRGMNRLEGERLTARGVLKSNAVAETPITRAIRKKHSESIAELQKLSAYAAAESGNYRQAYFSLDEAIRTYDGDNPYDFFSDATTIQSLEFQRALALLADNRKAEAVKELGAFVNKYSDSHLAIRAAARLNEIGIEVELVDVEKQSYSPQGLFNPSALCICGPASLKTVLFELGIETDLEDIIKVAGTTIEGTSMLGLVDSAQKYGVNATGVVMDKGQLKQLPLPAVLLLEDHYVALTNIQDNRVTYYDPLTGWESKTLISLQSLWSGNALIFKNKHMFSGSQLLSTEQMIELVGKYLCGNAGGLPNGPDDPDGGGGPGSGPGGPGGPDGGPEGGPGPNPDPCSELWGYIPSFETYANNEEFEQEYGFGGVDAPGCGKKNPTYERHDEMSDGYMDGFESYIHRVYGNYFFRSPTLILRGTEGNHLNFRLSYNSMAATRFSNVGQGWTLSYSDYITTVNNQVQWVTSTGRRNVFIRNVDGTFTAPVGSFDTLVQRADGTYKITSLDKNVMEFSQVGKLTSYLTPQGNGMYFFYDIQGNMIRADDTSGVSVKLEYGEHGYVSKLVINRNYWVEFEYNSDRLMNVLFPDQKKWSFSYGARFIASFVDRNNQETKFGFNIYGQILRQINAAGRVKQFSSNVIDYNGAVKGFTWDSYLRVNSTTDTFGQTVRYTYNADNRLKSVVDASGAEIQYTYDYYGNMIAVKDRLGNSIQYTYDNLGRNTSLSDPLGRVTAYEYDLNGNLTKMTDPLGRSEIYEYNNNNTMVRFTNK